MGALEGGGGSHSYADDELLPLSGIQHFSFCPRQWALVHVECQWQENLDTTMGRIFHEGAHLKGYSTTDGVVSERSMRVTSRELGLVGYCDVVELVPGPAGEGVERDGSWYAVRPVEYKKGRLKAEDCDRLQLTAQALCLEEMFGVRVDEGCLFYGETRRRERVRFSEELRSRVRTMAREMHACFEAGSMPPAVKRPCCNRCSLINECVPDAFERDPVRYWEGMGIDWKGI